MKLTNPSRSSNPESTKSKVTDSYFLPRRYSASSTTTSTFWIILHRQQTKINSQLFYRQLLRYYNNKINRQLLRYYNNKINRQLLSSNNKINRQLLSSNNNKINRQLFDSQLLRCNHHSNKQQLVMEKKIATIIKMQTQ